MLPGLRSLPGGPALAAAALLALAACLGTLYAQELLRVATFGRPEVAADDVQSPFDNSRQDNFLGDDNVLPIDLLTALRLAGTSNFDVSQAREFVNLSRLQLQRARLQMWPNLNFGVTYSKHQGKLAKAEGNIINANKDSLYIGGGPSATVSFTDAIFAPLVARQLNNAARAAAGRVQNDTLLAVAEAYFAVLRARRRLARADVTLEFLTEDKASPARGGSKGLLPVVEAMQKAGVAEALKAEVYRVQIEVLRRQEERAAALQDFRVATAELARLTRLDPTTPLWPIEDFRFPLDFDSPAAGESLDAQVELALANRPDLIESQFQIQAAVERLRAARYRPYLPSLVVNYAWGDFGGGPDPNPKGGGFGPSGRLLHFGSRTDLDVGLLWRVQNLGLGNRVEIREQETLERQATIRQLQLQDQVVTQVVQVNELIKGWGSRVQIVRSALFDPSGKPGGPAFEALRQNFTRLREEPRTRPLEVLDSIRGLSDFLEAYGQAMTDYERARFRLMIALGMPPEQILRAVSGLERREEER